jgi:hypothetical protein
MVKKISKSKSLKQRRANKLKSRLSEDELYNKKMADYIAKEEAIKLGYDTLTEFNKEQEKKSRGVVGGSILQRQKLDDPSRVLKEEFVRKLNAKNLVDSVGYDVLKDKALGLMGLQGDIAVTDKLKSMTGEGKSFKPRNNYKQSVEDINYENAISNLKETEVNKRDFQYKIDKLQDKNPLEINKVLSELYDILPTSQMNGNALDENQKEYKYNPTPSTYNYIEGNSKLATFKRPYIEMEQRKLKNIHEYISNVNKRRNDLENQYNVSAKERINHFMQENKLRENAFLLEQSRKTDPNKYLTNDIFQKALTRVRTNDIPTHQEAIDGARIAENAVKPSGRANWWNSKILHPSIAPEPSYAPSQMANILRVQASSYDGER